MEAYIFSKSDLSVKQISVVIDYEINLDEETNATSTIKIEKQSSINQGDFVFFNNYYFLIKNVEGEKNSNVISLQCSDIIDLFDRKIVEENTNYMTDNSLEYFIGQTISTNFVQNNDPILNIPYIDITINTQTQIIEPTYSENYLYNLKTFIVNCRQNKNIFTEFEILETANGNRLKIYLENKIENQILIDTTLNEVVDYLKVYNVDPVTKVECLIRNQDENGVIHPVKKYLYLKTNRTTTTDANDADRANGKTETISVDVDTTEKPAEEEMLNVFRANTYNHLVEFSIMKKSKLVDVTNLKIGTPVKIKTNDDIYDSYISAISISDDEFVKFKSGQLRVTLTDKLAQNKGKSIGNKLDINGGVINGDLNINGSFYIGDTILNDFIISTETQTINNIEWTIIKTYNGLMAQIGVGTFTLNYASSGNQILAGSLIKYPEAFTKSYGVYGAVLENSIIWFVQTTTAQTNLDKSYLIFGRNVAGTGIRTQFRILATGRYD